MKDLECARLEMNAVRLAIAGRGSSPNLSFIYVFQYCSWISSSIHIPRLDNRFTHQTWGSGPPIMQIVQENQGIMVDCVI